VSPEYQPSDRHGACKYGIIALVTKIRRSRDFFHPKEEKMDFGKSFVFMFQDPRWFRKLLIGTLLVLAGIIFSVVLVGFVPLVIVLGWAQVTLRNVLDGQEHPMPEWEDWGDFIVRGFKLGVAILIWWLPILILTIPIILGSALLGNQGNSGAAGAGGGVLIACASCLMFLWVVFVALISPAIYVRLAAFDRFSAAFEVGELWGFTSANIGNVILALFLLLLVSWIVVPIIGLIGLVLCVVGMLITVPLAYLWQTLVTAHLYGQIGAYGNRPVRSPVPATVPVLPAQYYEETAPVEAPVAVAEEAAPVEGLTVPEEAAVPVVEAPSVDVPAPEMPAMPEPPAEPPAPEEIK
jgi:hypothetical protein